MLPQANPASIWLNVRFAYHRVIPVINTTYAVLHRKIYFASDRAEPTILFHEHLAHRAKCS